jgi:hypothetical protein
LNITIEFTGLAKSIAGASEVQLDIPGGSTYRDLIRMLAGKYPAMIGILIAPNAENFLSSTMFVVNGDLAFPAMIIDESPKENEHIHLMSVITGG